MKFKAKRKAFENFWTQLPPHIWFYLDDMVVATELYYAHARCVGLTTHELARYLHEKQKVGQADRQIIFLQGPRMLWKKLNDEDNAEVKEAQQK